HLRCALFQLGDGVAFAMRAIREVRVAVDQTWQHRHRGEIEHFGTVRDGQILSNRLDLVLANKNYLVTQNRATIWINQAPCLDSRYLRRNTNYKNKTNYKN